MVVVVWLVGGALVLLIAWGVVSVTSAKLARTPRRAVFDIEEATDVVAARLPERVAGRLSHDDVRMLVRWQLTYFRERGVATFGGVDHTAERAARAGVAVVADEDELVDDLLARARDEGIDADAVDIVCVTDLVASYLTRIGAIGPAVDVRAALEQHVASTQPDPAEIEAGPETHHKGPDGVL